MFLAVYARTIVCITLVQAKKERKKGRKKERSGKGARLEPLANSAQAEARVVRSQSPHEYAQSNVNRNRLQAGIVPSCVSTPWTQMNRLLSSHLLVFRQCRLEDRNNIVLESSLCLCPRIGPVHQIMQFSPRFATVHCWNDTRCLSTSLCLSLHYPPISSFLYRLSLSNNLCHREAEYSLETVQISL